MHMYIVCGEYIRIYIYTARVVILEHNRFLIIRRFIGMSSLYAWDERRAPVNFVLCDRLAIPIGIILF